MNRPTNPGPFDLDDALRAVAEQVSPARDDAAAADRVRAGVRHARRRRAALTGVAAVLAVAAVGVGANAVLADDPRPVLPAPAPSPEPTPTPTPTYRATFPAPVTTDALLCQAPAPTPTGTGLLATATIVDTDVSVASQSLVDVAARVTVDDGARVSVLDPAALAGYVVVQDGVVVSSLLPLRDGAVPVDLADGDLLDLTVSVDSFASCDPAGDTSRSPSLQPGDYDLAVVVPWVVSSYALERDGTWGAPVTAADGATPLFDGWLVSAAVPFTVDPDPDADVPEPPVTPDPVPGAFPGPTTTFPGAPSYEDLQCGMPAPAPTGDELLARLEVPASAAATTGGEVSLPARLAGLPTARTETVDFRWIRAYVVVRDGVIVSSTMPATDSDGVAVLEPGEVQPLDHVVTTAEACDWGAPTGAHLPPGQYTVHAVHPWMLAAYSLQQQDGSWGAENVTPDGANVYSGWLVSAPVALTIS
jgi:hypothetical protein